MSTVRGFSDWCGSILDQEAVDELQLHRVLEIAASRIEVAASLGSKDPVATFANTAGDSARAASRSMLSHLGMNAVQVRIVRRLMAGSTGGWPGLIRLWLGGDDVAPERRKYARQQVRLYRAASRADEQRQAA